MNKNFLIIISIFIAGGLFYYFNFSDFAKSKKETVKEAEVKQTNSIIEQPGLKIEILREGTGKQIQNGDTAVVHYTGKLENGAVFDSSLTKGTPFSFVLGSGMVIKGWEYGVLGMKAGEKRKLTIGSDLAYGDAGAGGTIPPKATLIFEVELLEIK